MIVVCCHFDVLMNNFYFQVKEVLEQILQSHVKKSSKVLLVAANDKKAQHLSSSLKLGNCTVTDGSHGNSFTICSRCSERSNTVSFFFFLFFFLQFPIFSCRLNHVQHA
jgi:hypothetical protein